ncbi:MAG: hypothetical protein J6X02_05495 [Bacilli bacterium]|nr:hypothetical protein [Bacilli bacterium]
MKTNNKGFAISIMLYAMVLLIVTIFYIILAIVKNRYNVSEALVDDAVEFLEDNDSYASASDKAAPIIVFNQGTKVVKDSLNGLVIYVFDDSIDTKNIELTSNGANVTITCTRSGLVTSCVPNNYIISNDSELVVTATDNNHNISKESIKFYKATAPTCTIKVIDEKTCNSSHTSCNELSKEGSAYLLYYGDYATYELTCASKTGVDAYYKDSDFEDANKKNTLVDFKVTTERFPSKTVIKITVRSKTTLAQHEAGIDLTRPKLKTEEDATAPLKICDGYNGTDGNNCQSIQLPYLKIISPAITH